MGPLCIAYLTYALQSARRTRGVCDLCGAVELWSLAAPGSKWSPFGVRVIYDGQVSDLASWLTD